MRRMFWYLLLVFLCMTIAPEFVVRATVAADRPAGNDGDRRETWRQRDRRRGEQRSAYGRSDRRQRGDRFRSEALPPSRDEPRSRMMHLNAAARHLEAAGYESLAANVREELKKHVRRDRPARGLGGPASPSPAQQRIGQAVKDLSGEVERLQRDVDNLNRQMRQLQSDHRARPQPDRKAKQKDRGASDKARAGSAKQKKAADRRRRHAEEKRRDLERKRRKVQQERAKDLKKKRRAEEREPGAANEKRLESQMQLELQRSIQELELELSKARAMWGDGHPRVRLLLTTQAQLKEQLAARREVIAVHKQHQAEETEREERRRAKKKR